MKTFLAVLFDEAASLLRSHRLHLHSEDLRSPMNNVRSFTHYHFIKKNSTYNKCNKRFMILICLFKISDDAQQNIPCFMIIRL